MNLAALIYEFFDLDQGCKVSLSEILTRPGGAQSPQSRSGRKRAKASNLKTLPFSYSQRKRPGWHGNCSSHRDHEIRRYSMSPAAETEFLRLLKKDINCFERIVESFEELVPHLSAPIQDQWRLQAQSRRTFTMELMILLEKAERYSGSPATARGSFNLSS
jgi:hypothetical protein